MRINNTILFICAGFLIVYLLNTNQLKAQNGYFFIGLGAEKFDNMDPIKTIVNDYNKYHADNKYSFNELMNPDIIKDYQLGFKVNFKHSSLNYDYHLHRCKTVSEGYDSTGQNELYKKMVTLYSGFNINYNFYFIKTRYFRTGPGLIFGLEQFIVKVKSTSDPHYDSYKPVNNFMLSGGACYSFSFGGPKFNFDIIPFYHYPFWSVNLQNLNNDVNNGYAKSYTKEDMTFSPVSMGVLLKLCFGFKDNE